MQHADFTIGTEFETSTGQRWRCTDVGQRTILAIELRPELDPAWFIGPPYSLEEVVFDEQDVASAFRSQDDAIRAVLTRLDHGAHPGYPHAAVNRMMRARYLENSRRYPYPRLLRIDRVDATGRWNLCRMGMAGASWSTRRSSKLSSRCPRRTLFACGLQGGRISRPGSRFD